MKRSIIIYLPLVVLFILNNNLLAQQEEVGKKEVHQDNHQILEERSLGDGSIGGNQLELSEQNIYASLIYPSLENQGLDIINLNKPLQFEKEGVYIWREGKNNWNMQIMYLKDWALEVSIYSLNQINVTHEPENLTITTEREAIKFQSNSVNSDSSLIQFVCQDLPIEFNFKAISNIPVQNIFIGKQNKSPKDLNFNVNEYRPQKNLLNSHQDARLKNSSSSGGSGGGGDAKSRKKINMFNESEGEDK